MDESVKLKSERRGNRSDRGIFEGRTIVSPWCTTAIAFSEVLPVNGAILYCAGAATRRKNRYNVGCVGAYDLMFTVTNLKR